MAAAISFARWRCLKSSVSGLPSRFRKSFSIVPMWTRRSWRWLQRQKSTRGRESNWTQVSKARPFDPAQGSLSPRGGSIAVRVADRAFVTERDFAEVEIDGAPTGDLACGFGKPACSSGDRHAVEID